MYDPYTMAFEIKSPFPEGKPYKDGSRYHPALITIWHVDPESDGTDDSCDWWGRKRKLSRQEKAIFDATYDLETILDNRPFYPDHPAHLRFQYLKEAVYSLRIRHGWRLHPRWHIWHWKIQVRLFMRLKRWLWSRCAKCGKPFKWGYAPISTQWESDGPQWFRGEKNVYHHECLGEIQR